MDGVAYLATDGVRANDVRTHRDGDWPRSGWRVAQEISTFTHPDHGDFALRRELDQCGRRFVGHGRRSGDADHPQLNDFRDFVRRRNFTRHDLFPLSPDRDDPEMARSGPVRLCHHWVRSAPRLVGSYARCSDSDLAEKSRGMGTLVAILGTTISPYLFFWQTSQEVEEEKSKGRRMLTRRVGASKGEIITRKIDVDIGTFFSNLVMFFIILTTAMTLHVHGITNIQTSKDAAQALFPLAGKFAGTLFALGVIGTGLLAIPTLTGSAAYALAETFAWKEGLNQRFRGAKHFYLVIIASTAIGIAMDFLKVNPVRALYWSAVINGLLAPVLLVAVIIAALDRKLMKDQPSSISSVIVVSIATLLMFGAAIGMFVF